MTPSAPLPSSTGVLVVGAGLSGLSCASLLHGAGVEVHVVDASDDVGGRVRTDTVEGFRLDRGFQVLLTAYEEVQAQVDLSRLDLETFRAGSLIWNGRSIEKLGDPFRDPASALASFRAGVGTLGDKLRVARLRRRLTLGSSEACFTGTERSTQQELQALGFSDRFVDAFFRPFFGGVFLEGALDTTASLFRYYFRCFAVGDASVPAQGMQRLPELLAEPLAGRITLGCRVTQVSSTDVTVEGGQTLSAEQVVVAADAASATELVDLPVPSFKATVTAYFAAEEAPTGEPLLILDGERAGPANHVAVMSNVAPAYAPPGAHLISVSGIDRAAEDPARFRVAALEQLSRWFGPSVFKWRHLETYLVPHALPRHPAGSLRGRPPVKRADGVVMAGDYTEFGAIQGALLSGRRAAGAILRDR